MPESTIRARPTNFLRAPELLRLGAFAFVGTAVNDNFDDDPPPCASAPLIGPASADGDAEEAGFRPEAHCVALASA
jgi:hypothetical protein